MSHPDPRHDPENVQEYDEEMEPFICVNCGEKMDVATEKSFDDEFCTEGCFLEYHKGYSRPRD